MANVLTLQSSADGSPWANIVPNSTQDVDSLQYSKDGSPWWGYKTTASSGWKMVILRRYSGGVWTERPLKTYVGAGWVEEPPQIPNI